jgi:hypothetical protein
MRSLAFALVAASVLLPTRILAEEFETSFACALAKRGVEVKTNGSIHWNNLQTGTKEGGRGAVR